MNIFRLNKILCVTLLITSLGVFGQKSKVKDTTYIKSYRDKILLKVGFDMKSNDYAVNSFYDDKTGYLASNENQRIFLSFDYDFLGFSLGVTPQDFSINNDSELKGSTSYVDIGVNMILGKVVQGFQYVRIKGYYLENTNDFIPDWEEGVNPYLQFPNLISNEYKGYTSYVVNPKFSIRNLSQQTERQMKSAGSFIPTLNYSYNRYSNKDENIEYKENVFDIEFELSYYYTWVLNKNWFIAPNLSSGIGYRYSDYKLTEMEVINESANQFVAVTFEGGLQFGYDSGKIVFGASINFYSNFDNEDKATQIKNNQLNGILFFGYRLNACKGIKKPFDWAHKTFGF